MKSWNLLRALLLMVVPALLFAGCAKDPGAKRLEKYRDTDFLPYAKIADTSIEGRAFVEASQGKIQPASGRFVTLVPATPYHREWFERSVIGGEILKAPDTRVRKYSRTTTADMDGNFRFGSIAPGRYYIVSEILLEEFPAVDPNERGEVKKYRVAYAEVEVKEHDQLKNVIVTRPSKPRENAAP